MVGKILLCRAVNDFSISILTPLQMHLQFPLPNTKKSRA